MASKGAEPRSQEFVTDFGEDAIDLREYVKILRKHRWSIITVTLLLTSISALLVSAIAPVYRATSTLLIETQQTIPMDLDKIIGIDTKNKEYYRTQLEFIKSKALARRVVKEMDLYNHPELNEARESDTPAGFCLLYTSPSPRDKRQSRMPSSA